MKRLGAALALLLPAVAHGDPAMPARTGESGLLDVADAETLGLGGGIFGGELRFHHFGDQPDAFGPSPLALVLGLERFEFGMAMHEEAVPGDPKRAPLLIDAALKVHLVDGSGWRPAFGADVLVDRTNDQPAIELRALASTLRMRRIKLAAFAGGRLGSRDADTGLSAGLAMSIIGPKQTEIVTDVVQRPEGQVLGAALRWGPIPKLGISVGVDWLPAEASSWRFSLGVAFLSPAPPKPKKPPVVEEIVKKDQEEEEQAQQKLAFSDDRPRFRMRLPMRPPPSESVGRHLQYGPAVAPPPGKPAEEKPESEEKPAEQKPAERAPAEKPASPALPSMSKQGLPKTLAMRDPRGHTSDRPVVDGIALVMGNRTRLRTDERNAIAELARRAQAESLDVLVRTGATGKPLVRLSRATQLALDIKRQALRTPKLRTGSVLLQIGSLPTKRGAEALLLLVARPKAEPKPEPKPEPKIEPKPEPKTEPTLEPKADPKPALTPPAVPRPKELAKADVKAVPRATSETDLTPLKIPEWVIHTPAPTQTVAAPPVQTAAPQPAAETPKPDAPAEKPPRPARLTVDVAGRGAQLRDAILAYEPQLRRCVERQLKRDASAQGQATLRLRVGTSGRVSAVSAQEGHLAPFLMDCVRRAALRWRLPKAADPYSVDVPLTIIGVEGGAR